MPKYEVIEKGFHEGRLYDPNGKRRVIHTDKPLKPVPSWVKAVAPETAAEKKKRLAAEKRKTTADKKKAVDDKKDIDDMTFMGEGEKSSSVETL